MIIISAFLIFQHSFTFKEESLNVLSISSSTDTVKESNNLRSSLMNPKVRLSTTLSGLVSHASLNASQPASQSTTLFRIDFNEKKGKL